MLRINTKYYRITEDLKLEELEYVGMDNSKYVFHDQYYAEVKLAKYAAEDLSPSRIITLNELEEKLRFRINHVHDQLRRHKIKFNPINGLEVFKYQKSTSLVPVHKYMKNGTYVGSYPSVLSASQDMLNSGKKHNGFISAVCKGTRRTAYGHRWSYDKLDKLPRLPRIHRRSKEEIEASI